MFWEEEDLTFRCGRKITLRAVEFGKMTLATARSPDFSAGVALFPGVKGS